MTVPLPPRPTHHRAWKPGDLSAAPLMGLAALVGGMACGLGTIFVLAASDGKSTTWPMEERPISPAVMLAVLTAVANVLLSLAFSEGCTIAWWVKMLQGGNIRDCHWYWAYGSSAVAAVMSGRSFNKIALACMATALVVIDGPLLQRASTVVSRVTTKPVILSASMSPDPLAMTRYNRRKLDHILLVQYPSEFLQKMCRKKKKKEITNIHPRRLLQC